MGDRNGRFDRSSGGASDRVNKWGGSSSGRFYELKRKLVNIRKLLLSVKPSEINDILEINYERNNKTIYSSNNFFFYVYAGGISSYGSKSFPQNSFGNGSSGGGSNSYSQNNGGYGGSSGGSYRQQNGY